ncbi:helix-turn-helix domain-containing protein [Flammeovirga aprica]|uniref:Helix-turn-helix domain-containing protein n=1 Tax=Flammeovirga aprica JL-4 TaxID=694437 RepID=A0A7X9S1N0_9BACT|nr:helix-turn-helix domain-containing protein [Flammeovirga aprica]NME72753.1 helix-turn-helix domain-containing protein [Flammeovirga aprica JL-4]
MGTFEMVFCYSFMRFITELSKAEKITLKEAQKKHPNARFRNRCLALLLSDSGKQIKEIANFLSISKKYTISRWFNDWENYGIAGLLDAPKSGRPSKLNTKDNRHLNLVHRLLDKEKQDLDIVIHGVKEHLKVDMSKRTLNRFLKRLATDGDVLDFVLKRNRIKKK